MTCKICMELIGFHKGLITVGLGQYYLGIQKPTVLRVPPLYFRTYYFVGFGVAGKDIFCLFAGQAGAGQGRAGQGRAGQGRAGQGRAEDSASGRAGAGQGQTSCP